jgi:hypothetical protein
LWGTWVICAVHTRHGISISLSLPENESLRTLNCLQRGIINIVIAFMAKHISCIARNTCISADAQWHTKSMCPEFLKVILNMSSALTSDIGTRQTHPRPSPWISTILTYLPQSRLYVQYLYSSCLGGSRLDDDRHERVVLLSHALSVSLQDMLDVTASVHRRMSHLLCCWRL